LRSVWIVWIIKCHSNSNSNSDSDSNFRFAIHFLKSIHKDSFLEFRLQYFSPFHIISVSVNVIGVEVVIFI